MDAKLLKFDTLALHAGQRPDPATGARAVPRESGTGLHMAASMSAQQLPQRNLLILRGPASLA
jgi:O-acetylhomoserine/O-acetylserine sulfhydrylase-like pyridoxal-dependent enzyme